MSVWDYLAEICRLFVLLVFVLSAAGKVRNYKPFTRSLTALAAVPAGLVTPAAAAIVAAEAAVAGLLLLGGRWSEAGLAFAFAMLVVFTLVLVVALARGSGAACSCFGSSQHEVSGHDLARNALLTGACAFGLLHPGTLGDNALEAALLLGVAATAVVLSLHLREVTELILPARAG